METKLEKLEINFDSRVLEHTVFTIVFAWIALGYVLTLTSLV